ncbi:MAG: HAD family hydrolase [Cyanobacteria bacterium J06598_3]
MSSSLSQPHASQSGLSPSRAPQLLTPDISKANFTDIRLVATDMDGTLTVNGNFTPALLESFIALHAKGIEVLIVTGRSAGWVSGLVNYFPIVGAIAENGGLYIPKGTTSKDKPEPIILPDIPRITHHRDRLEALFNRLKKRYPHLSPSVDNPYRVTDWTFDIDGLTEADIAWMQTTCASQTMGFTYSTVQCHLKIIRQDKASGLAKVLSQTFPHLTPEQVITVGDSPNDESLFDASQFPHSVGVANVADYLPSLQHTPTYLTHAAEGNGFAELVAQLI